MTCIAKCRTSEDPGLVGFLDVQDEMNRPLFAPVGPGWVDGPDVGEDHRIQRSPSTVRAKDRGIDEVLVLVLDHLLNGKRPDDTP